MVYSIGPGWVSSHFLWRLYVHMNPYIKLMLYIYIYTHQKVTRSLFGTGVVGDLGLSGVGVVDWGW